MKISVSKEKIGCRVVVDYEDTWFLNFAIEYLCENEKCCETNFFACSYGAQVKSFKQKNGQKSRDTVPLSMFLLVQYQGQGGTFSKRGHFRHRWYIGKLELTWPVC